MPMHLARGYALIMSVTVFSILSVSSSLLPSQLVHVASHYVCTLQMDPKFLRNQVRGRLALPYSVGSAVRACACYLYP